MTRAGFAGAGVTSRLASGAGSGAVSSRRYDHASLSAFIA
jgi:hypothetical protein